MSFVLAVLLALSSTFAATPAPGLESSLGSLFDAKTCATPAGAPLTAARAEIEKFKREQSSEKALLATFSGWLAQERKTGKDVPALNWIRALNPWLLPPKFPARSTLTECASHLRSYSDARDGKKPDAEAAAEAITEWKDCLALAYNSEPPEEFSALLRCFPVK